MDNPVTKKEVRPGYSLRNKSRGLTLVVQHYRHWVVWKCPSVRFLDFQKVKLVERQKAEELFGTADKPSTLTLKVRTSVAIPARAFS
jgi:U2 small nuclear ribonucleoprotein A'